MTLRLLLAEDHAAFRGALKVVLNKATPLTEIVAEVGRLAQDGGRA